MAAERSLTKLGAAVADLEVAVAGRIADAEALHESGRHATSMAHAIYAVEIQLKVVICRRLDVEQLPAIFETHDLVALLLHSGLSGKIKNVRRPRYVARNWDQLAELSVEIVHYRYRSNPRWDDKLAARVLDQSRGRPHGVIPWLMKQ